MRAAWVLVALFGCSSSVEQVGGSGGGEVPEGGAVAGGAGEGAGVPTRSPCEVACTDVPTCADMPDCLEGCENARPEACGTEYDALVTCNTPYLGPECSPVGDVCMAEQQAYQSCLATIGPTQCTTGGQSFEGDSCEGTGACLNGQMARISCDATNAAIACTCFIDDVVVGECDAAELACALEASCCVQFY